MDPYKTNKLNHAIQKKLSELLELAVKDPRVGLVTINGVELNRDHSVARVFFSVLGDDDTRQTSLRGLKKAKGFLQSKLARSMRLRQTPDLRFVLDDTLERSQSVESVLQDLHEQGEFLSEAERRRRLTSDDFPPPAELIDALIAGERFWVVPHWNPDPDAMGGALALGEALRTTGRAARVIAYEDPPLGLADLPGFGDVLPAQDAAQVYEQEPPDTVVLVDCHRGDRCGFLEGTLARVENQWCIDHHLVSGRRAPVPGWVEARVCSASALVYQVISVLAAGADGRCMPFAISVDMATNLYAGIVNDTGGFRFSNTLPMTFDLARQLARLGVDTAAVARKTLHRYRPQGVALLQQVIGSFEYHADGRILTVQATREMLAATGGTLADTEGFVNLATAVEGVRYVAFMKELSDELWRISLRVRGDGDVQSIAARYGGGGHRQAAGCTIEGARDEVSRQLVSDLLAIL